MKEHWEFGEDGRWRTETHGAVLIIEQRAWGHWQWFITVDGHCTREGASATLTEARSDVAAAAAAGRES